MKKGKTKYKHHLHIYVSDEQFAYIDKMRKEGHTNTSYVVRIMIDRYMDYMTFLRGERYDRI